MLKLLGQPIGEENAFLPICLHIACLLAEIVSSRDCHGWYRSVGWWRLQVAPQTSTTPPPAASRHTHTHPHNTHTPQSKKGIWHDQPTRAIYTLLLAIKRAGELVHSLFLWQFNMYFNISRESLVSAMRTSLSIFRLKDVDLFSCSFVMNSVAWD